MPQVCYDSDRPFVFSYGGKPYIIPPNHGGKWKLVTEKRKDKRGRMRSITVAKKVGDSTRTYIDIPDEAWRQLQNDSTHLERHKGRVRVLQDVQSQLEAEMEDIKAAKAKLEEDQRQFADRLSIAMASEPKTNKKKTSARA